MRGPGRAGGVPRHAGRAARRPALVGLGRAGAAGRLRRRGGGAHGAGRTDGRLHPAGRIADSSGDRARHHPAGRARRPRPRGGAGRDDGRRGRQRARAVAPALRRAHPAVGPARRRTAHLRGLRRRRRHRRRHRHPRRDRLVGPHGRRPVGGPGAAAEARRARGRPWRRTTAGAAGGDRGPVSAWASSRPGTPRRRPVADGRGRSRRGRPRGVVPRVATTTGLARRRCCGARGPASPRGRRVGVGE